VLAPGPPADGTPDSLRDGLTNPSSAKILLNMLS
jgi:hypothetical protein